MTIGGGSRTGTSRTLESRVARVLTVGTLIGFCFLVIGLVAMAATGIGPTSKPWPALDLGPLVSDLRGLRASGFLWLGLGIVVLTPTARVVASGFGFAANREWRMALISVGIVSVILLSAILGAGG